MARHPILLLTSTALLAACRLTPLVDDEPGASVHVLPARSDVPRAADAPELATQISLGDGLDDKTVAMASGVVARGSGWSDGKQVATWSFGSAARIPAPVYVFVHRNASGELVPIDHPFLLTAIPGDATYRPILVIQRVVVTPAYDGELITSVEAFADARELGLIEEPIPSGTFFNGPVVASNVQLDVGGGRPAALPLVAYARGYRVEMFALGGTLGVQPLTGFVPTSQVSYLREAMKATYDAARPIFQAKVPTAPPTMKANYTPVSIVINVDLAPGVLASTITRDADLFTRSAMSGAITGTTANVAAFTVTTTSLNIQMQFVEGSP